MRGLVGWWRRRGIQSRSTIVATGVVAAAAAVGGVLLLAALSAGVEASIRSATTLRAEDFAAQFATDRDAASAAITKQSDDGTLLQILDPAGQVITASPALAGYAALAAPGAPSTRLVDGGMPDPGQYVVVARPTSTANGRVTVVAATSLEERDRTVAVVRGALLLGIPVLLLVVAATTWVSVGRSLASVDQIRDEVESIEATSLSLRVPVPRPRDEVQRLAITMNEMLERLEVSMEEQRRFVADASHELKSPLAALKSTVEVARRAESWMDEQDSRAIEAEIDRMSSLVADLLLLARADEGLVAGAGQDVDLDDILTWEAARLRASTALAVTTDVVTARIRGDRAAWERVLRNLTENAARFATSTIRLGLVRGSDGSMLITVEDDGPGIAAESRTAVLGRFVRLDEHRSRQQGGTGLGLAIVHDIVVAHGGEVRIDESSLGGARVSLRLPARAGDEVGGA